MGVWLDDEFPEHPKIEAMGSDLAAWLYVAGLCYCNRNLTGGRIPKVAALRLTNTASKKLIALLLAEHLPGRGPLWEDHGDHYRPHNYVWRQASAEKRRAEVEDGKKKRSEHARRAALARHHPGDEQGNEHELSRDRASPEHPPGSDPAGGGAVLGDAQALARPSALRAADPSPLPNNTDPPPQTDLCAAGAEEEEPLGRIDQACRIVAQRRLDRRLTKPELEPITDRPAWLARTAGRERQRIAADPGFAENMGRLADSGLSVERLADLIDPPERPAPSPYPEAGQQPAPAWDLDDQGLAVPRSVTA